MNNEIKASKLFANTMQTLAEVQGMVAANAWRAHHGQEPEYLEIHFCEKAEESRAFELSLDQQDRIQVQKDPPEAVVEKKPRAYRLGCDCRPVYPEDTGIGFRDCAYLRCSEDQQHMVCVNKRVSADLAKRVQDGECRCELREHLSSMSVPTQGKGD
jgi:hypothetical protein